MSGARIINELCRSTTELSRGKMLKSETTSYLGKTLRSGGELEKGPFNAAAWGRVVKMK